MKLLEIAGKKFRLASRFARMFAFFLDSIIIFWLSAILTILTNIFRINPFPANFVSVFAPVFVYWCCGMLFLDGFKNGQGIGKRLLSMQVIRSERR